MNIKPLCIALFAFTASTFADDGVDLSGEHRAYFGIPTTKHDDFDGNIKVPRLENDISVSAHNSTVTLHSGLRITARSTRSNNEQQILFKPLENSLSLTTGILQTTLGFQNYFWGSADKLNPVDNINSRDYTKGLDAEKNPLFSLSLKAYPTDRFSIEAVYAPFDQADEFPVDQVEKIPSTLFNRVRLQSVSFGQTGISTAFDQIEGVKRVSIDEPPFNPSSFLSGARIKVMSGTFDIAASYLYDLDQYYTPEITVEQYSILDNNTRINAPLSPEQLVSSMPSRVYGIKNITLKRTRINRLGLDAKTVVDRFGLWGEACFSITDKMDNSYESLGNQLDWTAGLDFTYGSSDQHYLNLQHVGRYIVDFDSDFSKRYPGGKPTVGDMIDQDKMLEFYYRLLTNKLAYATEGLLAGAALRSEWSFLDGNIKPILQCIYLYPFNYDKVPGKRYGDIYGNAEIDWKVTDAVMLQFGTQGYYSIFKRRNSDKITNLDENKIGLFFTNSRVYLQGIFNWNK